MVPLTSESKFSATVKVKQMQLKDQRSILSEEDYDSFSKNITRADSEAVLLKMA